MAESKYSTTAGDLERLFAKAIQGDNGCILYTARTNIRGYGEFWFRGKMWKAHRASYCLLVGEIPEGIHVLHKCDNPACINKDHLFLGTDQDNNNDMVAKGRADNSHKGSTNPRALVCEEDVLEIRRLYDSGIMTIAQLARRYGLTWRPTQMIVTRQTWRHV